MSTLKVVAIAGSIRKGSYNRMLIEFSKSLAPEGMEIEHVHLDDIPLYNMDLEKEFPVSVSALKEKIELADGILMAVPEHNYSFSGVLKNTIDWCSRPPGKGSWEDKPVVLQSAAGGWAGGVRAQLHLRQVLSYFPMRQMFFPEVCIGAAHTKFDNDGNLTDQHAVEQIRKQLAQFKTFIEDGR